MSRELSTNMTTGIYKIINILFVGFFFDRIDHEAVRREEELQIRDGYERNLIEQIRAWWKRHDDLCGNMHRPEELKEKDIKDCRDNMNKCSSCIYMLLRLLLFYSCSRYAPGSAFAGGDSATIWKTEK